MTVYPRVLVVNAGPFNRRLSHGIVMSNLFGGWPRDRLASIGFTQNLRPDFDVCEKYWLVKRSDILKGLVGRSSNSAITARNDSAEVGSVSDGDSKKDRAFGWQACLKRFAPRRLRSAVNETFYRLPTALSRPLRSWIAAFDPHLVFSMLGSGSLVRLNVKISEWRGIPCVPYFTDDWISWLYSRDLLSRSLRRSLEGWFQRYLQRSPLRLTCSSAMAEEYAKRYGGEFAPCLYPVDASVHCASGDPVRERDVLKLVYLGTLKPDRWRSLREIGEALLQLHSEGLRAEMSVYTHPGDIEAFGRDLLLEPVMRIVGTATPEEVPQLQRAADILVHVESFTDSSVAKTRLSMSTKIPQYLMAGRCVFAYGPAEVASMRYIAETGAGSTVGQRNPEALCSALRELITSGEKRRYFAERGRSVAMQNHEATGQRERMRMLLSEVKEKWRSGT